MTMIFGVDFPAEIFSAMGDQLPELTLIKIAYAGLPLNPTQGRVQTETLHLCRGIVDKYREGQETGTTVQDNKRTVLILAGSLPEGVVPAPNDRILVEGIRLTIAKDGVERDPASATYLCRIE